MTGIDFSPESVKVARKRNVYNNVQEWDIQNVPYPLKDNTYDIVVCTAVLTYIPEKEIVFNEWYRILKPEGLVVCTHRSDIMVEDKHIFDKMVKQNKWDNIFFSESEFIVPKMNILLINLK